MRLTDGVGAVQAATLSPGGQRGLERVYSESTGVRRGTMAGDGLAYGVVGSLLSFLKTAAQEDGDGVFHAEQNPEASASASTRATTRPWVVPVSLREWAYGQCGPEPGAFS